MGIQGFGLWQNCKTRVGGSRINVPVAGSDRGPHGFFRGLATGRLPCAEANAGNMDTVVQYERICKFFKHSL